jgi:transposase
MAVRPQPLPPIPEATLAAVQAAFPTGNLYVALRAEFGTLSDEQRFAALSPPQGRPVAVAPWRFALVVVMQSIEGLTDRQAADAVRRCMDWKYALSLELTASGFDFTLLHDFRCRVLAYEAGQRFLDTFLAACNARGWLKARGTQRTDSTHVLAAIRTCTGWNVSWKPCLGPSTSSATWRPHGCSTRCRLQGTRATACAPTAGSDRRARAMTCRPLAPMGRPSGARSPGPDQRPWAAWT